MKKYTIPIIIGIVAVLLFAEDVITERKFFINFTGGLNTRVASHLIDDSETPSCFNVVWDSDGVLKMRRGTDLKATLSTPSKILGSYVFKRSNGAVQYVVQNGSCVFVSDYEDMTSSASIRTGASTYKPLWYAALSDTLYMGNGVDYVNGYNGVTLSTYTFIPKFSIMTVYASRLWGSGEISNPSQLRYSDDEYLPTSSDSWRATNAINVGKDEGDRITWIGQIGNALIIGKERSLWQLTGSSIDDFYLRCVNKDIGIADGGSAKVYNGELYFLSREGWYKYSNGQLANISNKIYDEAKAVNQLTGQLREWRTNTTSGFDEGTKSGVDSSTNCISLSDTYKEWNSQTEFAAGTVDASSNVNIIGGVVQLTTITVPAELRLSFTVDVVNENGTSVGYRDINNINDDDPNNSGRPNFGTSCKIDFAPEWEDNVGGLRPIDTYALTSGVDCRIIQCKFGSYYDVKRISWSWTATSEQYASVIVPQIKYYMGDNSSTSNKYGFFCSALVDGDYKRIYGDDTIPNPRDYPFMQNPITPITNYPITWMTDVQSGGDRISADTDWYGPWPYHWWYNTWAGTYYGNSHTNEIQIRLFVQPKSSLRGVAGSVSMNINNIEIFGDAGSTNDTYASSGYYISDALTKADYDVVRFEAFISTPSGTSITWYRSIDNGATFSAMTMTETDGGKVYSNITADDATNGWKWKAVLASSDGKNSPSILYAYASAVNGGAGTYTSKVFYAYPNSGYGIFLADDDTTNGTVAYQIRSSATAAGLAIESYANITSGSQIPYVSTSVYIQWKATLNRTGSGDVYLNAATISWYPSYYAKNCASAIYDAKYYCSVSTGTQSLNNVIYVYDIRYGAWTMYTGINANTFYVSDLNNMYYGDANTTGKIFQMETGYDDNGSNIKTYWQSKDFDFGYINNDKFPTKMFVFGNGSGGTPVPMFAGIAEGYTTAYTTTTFYFSSAPYTSNYMNYDYQRANRFWHYKVYSDTQTYTWNLKMTGFEYGVEPWRP